MSQKWREQMSEHIRCSMLLLCGGVMTVCARGKGRNYVCIGKSGCGVEGVEVKWTHMDEKKKLNWIIDTFKWIRSNSLTQILNFSQPNLRLMKGIINEKHPDNIHHPHHHLPLFLFTSITLMDSGLCLALMTNDDAQTQFPTPSICCE